jgi:hypothetical protein
MSTTSYRRTVTLPITEERVLVLNKQPDAPRAVLFRHLGKTGETNPATAKWQESQDGTNWDDIAGTAQVVSAGAATSWLLTSSKPYVALAAFGNVDIEVEVNRSDPDQALPETVNL